MNVDHYKGSTHPPRFPGNGEQNEIFLEERIQGKDADISRY